MTIHLSDNRPDDPITIAEKIIRIVEGRAMPKLEANQNTDDMVYGEFLNEVSFAEMAKYLFYNERFTKDGKPIETHPFNNPAYRGARILLAGPNFGTGSSREHAVQALKKYGITAIVAPDYAGIFQTNCSEVGLVAVTMPIEGIADLTRVVRTDPSMQFRLDLEGMKIHYSYMAIGYGPNKAAEFKEMQVQMPDTIRASFLTGTWDALPLLQRNQVAVERYIKDSPFAKFR